MTDATESTRRAMLATGQPQAELAAETGQTWTTAELQRLRRDRLRRAVRGRQTPVRRRGRLARIHALAKAVLRVEGGRMMDRQPWNDIRIRETPEGPEVVFDGGVQGWVIPATEADLATLERRMAERRQAQAAGLLERRGR